jgi:hypothetical protein
LPLIGIVVALCLFVVAAGQYPGGTLESTSTVGYNWTHNFISSLFQPRALNGAANPARHWAVPALLVLSVSLAVVYVRIAATSRSQAHKKTIQIAGIGAMVYGFLVATPMHDLMVSIGLVFSLVALVATTHMLYVERQRSLFGWGVLCLALTALAAAMYYGHTLWYLLPVVQKVGASTSVVWLLCVYYARLGVTKSKSSEFAVAIAPAP